MGGGAHKRVALAEVLMRYVRRLYITSFWTGWREIVLDAGRMSEGFVLSVERGRVTHCFAPFSKAQKLR